jgi:plastocyanin
MWNHSAARTILTLFALFIAAAGCTSDDPTGNGGAAVQNAEVDMDDNVFRPSTVRVLQGGTVRWTNEGSVQHNTTSLTAGLWASANLNPNGTFTQPFPTVGTFNYRCTLHPGMNGTVIVE